MFGRGRENILKALNNCHSLNTAEKTGYILSGGTWRLKASKERMGIRFVDTDANKRSLQLTPKAKDIIARFKKLEQGVKILLHEAD